MSPGIQIVLSGALSFGVPLVLAARELIVLRRRGDGFWRRDESAKPPKPPQPLSWQPSLPPFPRHREEPDLLPPSRVRELA